MHNFQQIMAKSTEKLILNHYLTVFWQFYWIKNTEHQKSPFISSQTKFLITELHNQTTADHDETYEMLTFSKLQKEPRWSIQT